MNAEDRRRAARYEQLEARIEVLERAGDELADAVIFALSSWSTDAARKWKALRGEEGWVLCEPHMDRLSRKMGAEREEGEG